MTQMRNGHSLRGFWALSVLAQYSKKHLKLYYCIYLQETLYYFIFIMKGIYNYLLF